VAALGSSDWPTLAARIERVRSRVRGVFEQVFRAPQAEPPGRGDQTLHDLWAGTLDAEEARQAVAGLGLHRPEDFLSALETLRRSARVRALSARGRDRLDALMPLLLGALGQVEDADAAWPRLLRLVESILGRTPYLDLLVENPLALSQVVRLCAASPWVAEELAAHPLLLDELVDPRRLREPLAEVVLEAALERAWRYLVARHGEPRSEGDAGPYRSGFAIIGYGKLGGIELGYGSDLDLVFLHDDRGGQTDGPRPIDNGLFFARLAQRLMHILTAFTPAGRLYEVDTRLRPSGAAGVLVSSVAAFARYQRESAWTWEHQALVRARPVAGCERVGADFRAVRAEVLGRRRDPDELRREVADMRARMRENLSRDDKDHFDLKHGRGGLVDIEFLVQYAVLRWAGEHPALLRWTDNLRLLETLADEGLWSREDADDLAAIYRRYRARLHHLTLQQRPARIPADEFAAERARVTDLWRRWLG